jgi:hypothetical protein
MQLGSFQKIIAGSRAQKIRAETLALFLEAVLRVRGLHVVDRGHRASGVAKRGMRGDVVDLLRADVNDAAVAQRPQMLTSGL